MGGLGDIGRRLLFTLDPETAHGMSIAGLRAGVPFCRPPAPDARLKVSVAGLAFPNPLGMAAGYDKDGEVPDALLSLGFGFAEIGTVTPRPQTGNPRPRIFRLVEDQAVINRLGFNNRGHEACWERLAARRDKRGIVGVNIGANKDSADRIADYVAGIERFAPVASYLTVNVSSPNTPSLRDLQARNSLGVLLSAVMAARDGACAKLPRQVPVFLKIAPDLTQDAMDDIAVEATAHSVDGLIVSNTTLARKGLKNPNAREAGGLSGRPLFGRSTIVLARMRRLVGPKMPVIGVGGVNSAETALEKIRAGADLVQLYTGLIYGGPSLPGTMLSDMSRILDREKVEYVSRLRDTRLAEWADRPLD